MRKSNLWKLACILLLGSALAGAQAPRTWVSGVGDDANPCSRTAPCKTWAGAYAKTAAGGEIDALDPGGFGALTIGHSLTLDGGGGQVASTLVSGTNGIVVAAGASDVVILRNIRFNGLLNTGNPGTNGISFISGKFLSVEHCDVFGFNTNGINIASNATATVVIRDSTVMNNANAGISAVGPNGTSLAQVSIERSSAGNNGTGVIAGDHSRVSIINSSLSENNIGLNATSSGGDSVALCEHCDISNNGVGVKAGSGPSAVYLADSTISFNTVGFTPVGGGTSFTYGNNRIQSNASDGVLPSAPANGLR